MWKLIAKLESFLMAFKEPKIIVVKEIPKPFPKWTQAVTIYPLIILEEEIKDNKCIMEHELYHWKQARSWGVIPWYICYLILSLFYIGKPSDKHPLEREPYRIQRECESHQKKDTI